MLLQRFNVLLRHFTRCQRACLPNDGHSPEALSQQAKAACMNTEALTRSAESAGKGCVMNTEMAGCCGLGEAGKSSVEAWPEALAGRPGATPVIGGQGRRTYYSFAVAAAAVACKVAVAAFGAGALMNR